MDRNVGLTGAERIAAERERQMAKEGWSSAHDDGHDCGELAIAAACYAVASVGDVSVIAAEETRIVAGTRTVRYVGPDAFPWEERDDKRKRHSDLRRLEIAGALIAAEIDRLLRGPA